MIHFKPLQHEPVIWAHDHPLRLIPGLMRVELRTRESPRTKQGCILLIVSLCTLTLGTYLTWLIHIAKSCVAACREKEPVSSRFVVSAPGRVLKSRSGLVTCKRFIWVAVQNLDEITLFPKPCYLPCIPIMVIYSKFLGSNPVIGFVTVPGCQ